MSRAIKVADQVYQELDLIRDGECKYELLVRRRGGENENISSVKLEK